MLLYCLSLCVVGLSVLCLFIWWNGCVCVLVSCYCLCLGGVICLMCVLSMLFCLSICMNVCVCGWVMMLCIGWRLLVICGWSVCSEWFFLIFMWLCWVCICVLFGCCCS